MAATREDVDRWIETAKEKGYKYIISVCDSWDYEDYPVYCKDKKELKEETPKYSGVNMQRINEVITINSDGSVNEKDSLL